MEVFGNSLYSDFGKYIEKAAKNYGNLIPVKKQTSDGRFITYWRSPEDMGHGKSEGQLDLFAEKDDSKVGDRDGYFSHLDKDTEEYRIKPLVSKLQKLDSALSDRMEKKYREYPWDRDTRDLDLKLDEDTAYYLGRCKKHPEYMADWQEEYNEQTDRVAKMLNSRKLAMARLKKGSTVNLAGKPGKIVDFSRRGYPIVESEGEQKTCFVEEIADIDALAKKLAA